jgi:hypothetical protein
VPRADLIGDEARALLEPPGRDDTTPRAVAALEREVNAPVRLLAGTGAVVLAVVGALVAEVGVGLLDGFAGAAVVAFAVAAGALAAAALLGRAVARAGRRVSDAYVDRASRSGSSAPGGMVTGLFSGRMIVRSALSAVAVIGLLMSASGVYYVLVVQDDSVLLAFVVVMTVTWAATAWCLLRTELAVSRSLGLRTQAWGEERRTDR